VAVSEKTGDEYDPVLVNPNLTLSRFSSFTASATSSCVVTSVSDFVVVSSDSSTDFSVTILRVEISMSSTVPPGESHT